VKGIISVAALQPMHSAARLVPTPPRQAEINLFFSTRHVRFAFITRGTIARTHALFTGQPFSRKFDWTKSENIPCLLPYSLRNFITKVYYALRYVPRYVTITRCNTFFHLIVYLIRWSGTNVSKNWGQNDLKQKILWDR